MLPTPPCRPLRRCPLPLELSCEIFKCLKLPNQPKFIWALGRGIYGMFGQQLLIKSTRLRNPKGNAWNCKRGNINMQITIHPDGLSVVSHGPSGRQRVVAERGFPISVQHSRADLFPGTILYYFELNHPAEMDTSLIGLASSNERIRKLAVYGCRTGGASCCLLASTKRRYFEWPWPNGIQPRWEGNGNGNVSGCGLWPFADSNRPIIHQLSIFFTVNGTLLGKPIPINPLADFLYSYVS